MNVNPDVNFQELARCTEDFNGAQLKAVCVEAGMIALRREATCSALSSLSTSLISPPPPLPENLVAPLLPHPSCVLYVNKNNIVNCHSPLSSHDFACHAVS